MEKTENEKIKSYQNACLIIFGIFVSNNQLE
jgi:hypothetical protein